jgi:hypothetical protein
VMEFGICGKLLMAPDSRVFQGSFLIARVGRRSGVRGR